MENVPQDDNPVALFPLPATVFFPGTRLPLHIFEPRYREMMAHALETDGPIGMVLLKPGWEADYYGRPEIARIGCLGKIHSHQRLPDGKYNLVLHGLSRFRVLREVAGKNYRRAEIELLEDINDQPLSREPEETRDRLVHAYRAFAGLLPENERPTLEANWAAFTSLSALVDSMAHRLQPTVEEKQSLLEELDVPRRAGRVGALIEMKTRLAQISMNQTHRDTDIRLN